jgi:hypothetical protein
MRIAFLLFIFLSSGTVLAQKRVLKQWDATQMESLSFEAQYASSIKIITTNSNQLTVSAIMDGEYANALYAGMIQNNGDWTLVTSFESFGQIPNDKLAAHKVKSLVLEIELPRNKEIAILAPNASLYVQGNFKNVNAQLLVGNCTLKNFMGNAQLKILDGDTTVYALYGIAGKATSKNGRVTNWLPESGEFFINVQSNNGNIYLQNVPR